MRMNHNRIVGVLSIVVGMILVGIGAWLNASEVAKTDVQGYSSPVVVMVAGIAAGSALAAVIIPIAWRQGSRFLAVLVLLGTVAGEAYGFVLTMERVIAARDARAVIVASSNEPRSIAQERLKRAIAEVQTASMVAASARSDKKCDSSCQSREKAAEIAARERLAEAESTLAKTLPPSKALPIAETLGVPAAYVELVPALAAPLALLVLGLTMIAFGCGPGGDKREPDTAPVPGARPDRESALAWIQEETRRNGGVPPRFHVVKSQLGLPKATAHRYLTEVRKASGE